MLSDIWFPLVTLCCITWITWIFFKSKQSRIQPPLPPGPTGLPVVGMLPFLSRQLHTYFTHLAQTYGPLMSLRLGRKTVVVVSSPLLAKQMLKDFDVSFANHDATAAGREFTFGGNDTPFIPYGPEWRFLRKVSVNGMLGSTALDGFCDLRRKVINETIRYVYEQAGSPDNIGEQMFVLVLNVITTILWGKTMEGTDMDVAKEGDEFRRVVTRVLELAGSPNVSDFFPGLERFDLQSIVKKMRDCTKRLNHMVEVAMDKGSELDAIGRGESCDDDRKDFLQFLLQLKDTGDRKTTITTDQIKGLFAGMIIGGTHTTTNTLEFAMAEMASNPEIMRKAQKELETVVGAGIQVEESHIHQLIYLQAIVKETLRLHPVFPLLVPRSPSQSCIIGGYTIPKVSAVFFNMWAIQRDPSLWEGPLEFKLERFLDGRYDFNGNNFTYLPFGSGRRICAGIGMAERTIMLSLASLLHYFDWKLPKEVEKLDLSEKFGFALQKATPLMLIPSTRSSNLGNLCSP